MNYIILRGLVREQRHWGNFCKELEEGLSSNSNKAKIFPIDLPGFGTEILRTSPTSVAGIVMDMRTRWLKDYGSVQGDWGIIAVSLGGMCALEWASSFPTDFKKVILINSSVKGLSPIHKRMIPKNYFTVIRSAAIQDLYEREKIILAMTSNLRGQALEELARKHASFLSENPPKLRNAIAQLTAAIRFKAPKKISVPLLVLSSNADTLVDPSCSEQIARYYKAPHKIQNGGNHDLPLDDPKWVINEIKNWEPHASPTSFQHAY